MTPEALLSKLADAGCGLGVTEAGSVVFLPAVLEVVGNQLFWVNQFASDQHDSHRVSFYKASSHYDVGVVFADKGGSLIAYAAPYAEWPDLDLNEARAERARWLEYLKDRETKAAFDRFVESQRSLLTEGG